MLTRLRTSLEEIHPLRVMLFVLLALACTTTSAFAFNGPYASLVNVEPGVDIDVDVRWPDTGSPPAAGWPVIFFAHGAGGDKNSFSGLAGGFADSGYVTVNYTNLPEPDRSPTNFANDIVRTLRCCAVKMMRALRIAGSTAMVKSVAKVWLPTKLKTVDAAFVQQEVTT